MATFILFKRLRQMNAHVSGIMLKALSLDFSKSWSRGIYKLKWMARIYKKRDNISEKNLLGESNYVDDEKVGNFKERCANFIGNFDRKIIFNDDDC